MAKYSSTVALIEESRKNGNCDFIDPDDPYDLERYAFEKYYMHDLKEAKDILEIVIAGCQRAKDFQMNIDCDLIIPWITPLLKKYPILKHIDERIVPNINGLGVPKKEDLRLIFAKAIACLYFIKKYF